MNGNSLKVSSMWKIYRGILKNLNRVRIDEITYLMKKEFKTLSLEKLTIARISSHDLQKVQGGSSDFTDPDPHTVDPELNTGERDTTYSHFQ